MSFHTFQHYIFETNLPSESSSHQDDSELTLRDLESQLYQLQSHQPTSLPITFPSPTLSLPITPWIPSKKFLKLLNTKSFYLNLFFPIY